MPRGATKQSWIIRRANGNGTAWNKGKKMPQITGSNSGRWNSVELNCRICYKRFTVRGYRKDTANYCSQICAHKGRQNSEPTYNALHKWVNFHKGMPRKCEHCGRTDLEGRRYDWVSKSHQYKRELNDWIRLCKSCHRQYDKIASA